MPVGYHGKFLIDGIAAAVERRMTKRLQCEKGAACTRAKCPCEAFQQAPYDPPPCGICGAPSLPSGSCFVCPQCGETTGCS